MTRDDSGQEELLTRIGSDLDQITAYSQQLVDTRTIYGLTAAIQFEANGGRIAAMDRTTDDLLVFTEGGASFARQTVERRC